MMPGSIMNLDGYRLEHGKFIFFCFNEFLDKISLSGFKEYKNIQKFIKITFYIKKYVQAAQVRIQDFHEIQVSP